MFSRTAGPAFETIMEGLGSKVASRMLHAAGLYSFASVGKPGRALRAGLSRRRPWGPDCRQLTPDLCCRGMRLRKVGVLTNRVAPDREPSAYRSPRPKGLGMCRARFSLP